MDHQFILPESRYSKEDSDLLELDGRLRKILRFYGDSPEIFERIRSIMNQGKILSAKKVDGKCVNRKYKLLGENEKTSDFYTVKFEYEQNYDIFRISAAILGFDLKSFNNVIRVDNREGDDVDACKIFDPVCGHMYADRYTLPLMDHELNLFELFMQDLEKESGEMLKVKAHGVISRVREVKPEEIFPETIRSLTECPDCEKEVSYKLFMVKFENPLSGDPVQLPFSGALPCFDKNIFNNVVAYRTCECKKSAEVSYELPEEKQIRVRSAFSLGFLEKFPSYVKLLDERASITEQHTVASSDLNSVVSILASPNFRFTAGAVSKMGKIVEAHRLRPEEAASENIVSLMERERTDHDHSMIFKIKLAKSKTSDVKEFDIIFTSSGHIGMEDNKVCYL